MCRGAPFELGRGCLVCRVYGAGEGDSAEPYIVGIGVGTLRTLAIVVISFDAVFMFLAAAYGGSRVQDVSLPS